MKRLDNRKGFVLAFVVMIVLVLSILIPSFYYLAFSHYNAAILDGNRQQAYYNANSGIEYALFIVQYRDPLDLSTWPNGFIFTCFANDPNNGRVAKGSVTISISQGVSASYDITSIGTVNNVTMTIKANYNGGSVGSWHH